jgi:hypothetical protein
MTDRRDARPASWVRHRRDFEGAPRIGPVGGCRMQSEDDSSTTLARSAVVMRSKSMSVRPPVIIDGFSWT